MKLFGFINLVKVIFGLNINLENNEVVLLSPDKKTENGCEVG